MARRGTKPDYVTGRDGRLIVGLSRNSCDGRYYLTHSKPRKWLGKDFDLALIRLREWEALQTGQAVTIVHPHKLVAADASVCVHDDPTVPAPGDDPEFDRLYPPLPTLYLDTPDDVSTEEAYRWLQDNSASMPEAVRTVLQTGFARLSLDRQKWTIPEDLFWAEFRKRYAEDPKRCAELSGLPLDRLHQFLPVAPSAPLEDLLTLYLDRPKATRADGRREARAYWNEFVESVQVKTVDHITINHVARYHDEVYREMQEGKSPSYVRNRFLTVKAILSHAGKRGRDSENVQRVLGYCRMLELPKQNGNAAKDISREDFRKLLDKADLKWQAILLLSLNCAMYPVDVANVHKSAIDLDKGTLRDERTKTGVPRIAVLWKRTIKAIRDYQASKPHKSEYLFVSSIGKQYHPRKLTKGFARLRTKAFGDNNTVAFNHIRDGAQTAAIESGADPLTVDMLLGHRTGIRDDYLRRKPSMVAKACEGIERYYFG